MSDDVRFRVDSLADEPESRRLLVHWGDGHESRFHYVWLRHACFYPANPGLDPDDEMLRAPDDPDRLAVGSARVENGCLTIGWGPDGKQTRHEARWLREHCYCEASRRGRKHRPSLWDGAAAAALPWFDYEDLRSDEAIYRLYLRLRDYGIARL